MGGKRLICKVLQDGARQSASSAGFAFSSSRMAPSMANPLSSCIKVQGPSRGLGAGSRGEFSTGFASSLSHGTMAVHRWFPLCCWSGAAGIHIGRITEAPVEPTYGVGPVGGADRDAASKGSAPDDFRADGIHMAEPKEITKEKAAVAQEEPPDYQVKKVMPQWQNPVEEKAVSQREFGDKLFEGDIRKVEGTAEYQGDTKGTESGDEVVGQYGSTPSAGKTTRT